MTPILNIIYMKIAEVVALQSRHKCTINDDLVLFPPADFTDSQFFIWP